MHLVRFFTVAGGQRSESSGHAVQNMFFHDGCVDKKSWHRGHVQIRSATATCSCSTGWTCCLTMTRAVEATERATLFVVKAANLRLHSWHDL